jgi:hypothetical protein
MFQRKIKAWFVKRKYRLNREAALLSTKDILELEEDAHKKYLAHGRHTPKEKEDSLYWKGVRDGIRLTWK